MFTFLVMWLSEDDKLFLPLRANEIQEVYL